MHHLTATALSICTLAVLIGCTSPNSEPAPATDTLPSPLNKTANAEPNTPDKTSENTGDKVAMTDKARASALWEKIASYKNWQAPQGFEGVQESDSVHGDFVRFFVNGTAAADIASLPAGSILVKEGYRDAAGTSLKAITAMQRIQGYGAAGDWFFVRYNDSGKATRINRGCYKCHDDAEGGDYVFIND